MKLKSLLILILVLSVNITAQAYDFTQSGLCYNITSSSERTVAVAGQTQDHTTLVIPSEVTHNGVTYSVTAIANEAFYWQYAHTVDITSLTLPESIKEIGDRAFAHNRISEVNIPASVEHIGQDAFGGTWYYHYGPDNEDYYQVYYPETYTVSNDNLFYSSYKGILYDKDKTKLIDCPNSYSGDIYLPSSLKEIPSGAFSGRNNHNLYVNDLSRFCEIDVTGIGGIYGSISKIYYYGVPSWSSSSNKQWLNIGDQLIIPANVTKIGRGIFYGCKSFTSVSFPTNGVTEVGDYAFARTKITEVTLPATIQTIGQNAFYEQWFEEQTDVIEYDEDGDPYHPYITWTMEMGSLTIPQGVQSIGSNAFNLTSGATVTSKSTTPSDITSNAFKNASNCTLAVAQGLQSTYSQQTGWNSFGTISENETICPYLDGEVFTATTAEGIEMTFTVLSAANKIAQVGDGSNPAIDQSFDGDLVIPSQINGLIVTDVGCKAFYNCQNLQSVEIQEGISNLGQNGSDRNWTYGPFYGAKIAHSVILPNTLTFIGMVSFYNAEIGDITLPSSLNSISLWAFEGAKIGALNIPYSETDLYCYYDKSSGTNYEVFQGAQIGTLTLDRNIKPDQYSPFCHTTINELHVGPNGHAVIRDWCTITEYYPKVEETLKMDGAYSNSIAFSTNQTYCRNVHLPEGYITIQKVLGGTCYMNIPSTVTTISANAGISLEQPIVLPEGLQVIGDNAITWASSVTALAEYPISINEAAFSSNVYQKTLYVPSGSKERYESTTGWNKFANIIELGDLGNPIQFTDEHVKRVCIREYDINGDGELSEGEAALVTDLSFHSTIYRDNPSITSFSEITYFTGLTSIGSLAFSGWSGLTSFTISEGVTSIGEQAFSGCSSLVSVVIPSSVESIGGSAFYYCPNLTSVRVDIEVPISGGFAFSNRSNATLYVPVGCKAAYEAADYWKEFKEIVEMEAPNNSIASLSELSNSKLYTFTDTYGTLRVNNNTLENSGILLDANHMGLVTNVSQLSSPYTDPYEGSLEALLDNNVETFWHSDWHNGSVAAHTHYLQVDLTESVNENICLQVTRRQTTNNHITQWGVYGSNNATAADGDWEELASINMPYGTNMETRFSAPFDTKGYRYLRFYIDNTTGDNYGPTRGFGHLSEFRLFKASDLAANANTDNSENSQFAILNINNKYYLYSLVKQSFWLAEGTFSTATGTAVTFSDSGSSNDYKWTVTMPLDDHTVSLNFSEMPYKITPVADFDSADALAAFVEGLGLGTTFTVAVPCGGGTADLTFKVTNLSPLEVEVSASPESIAGALTIPATVQDDNGLTFAVTAIGYDAFLRRNGITSVTLPEGLTRIYDRAFNECANLASANLPSTLANIYQGAFMNCVALSSINIPNGVTTISLATFQNTPALKSIALHEGITTIDYDAFRGSGLESVKFPTTLTKVEHEAFTDCKSLASIDFNRCPAIFEYNCFWGCTSLDELNIPNTVKFENSDGTWSWTTFWGCTLLRSVVFEAFEGGQDRWSTTALFDNCTALETIVLPSTSVMQKGFFYNCTNLQSVTYLEVADDFDPRKHNFNKMYYGLDPNLIQFTVPAGTAETLLKAGYMHLSDKSGLAIVRSEFEAEATRITNMANALTDGDKTTLTTAISEARTIVNAAEDYAPIYAQIASIKSAAKTFLSTATLSAGFDVTAAFVINPDFDNVQFGWHGQLDWPSYPPHAFKQGWNEATYENADVTLNKFYDVVDIEENRTLSDGTISQTISNLPAGTYRLECDAIATWQDDASVEVTGVNLFAGTATTAIATENEKPQHFTVEFTQAQRGDCTIGIDINNTTANWVAMDNVRLYRLDVEEKNHLSLPDAEGIVGGKATIKVDMTNEDVIAGVQFKVKLPTGMNVNTNGSGGLKVSGTSRTSGLTVSASYNEQSDYYQVLIYGVGTNVSGNSGTLVTLEASISDALALGNYEVDIYDIALTDVQEKLTYPSNAKGTIQLVNAESGDANRDGIINVADIICIANYILGNTPSNFDATAANVNGDAVINVADIIRLANIILYGNGASVKEFFLENNLDPQ